jgi:CheY-like chemotaxis protein
VAEPARILIVDDEPFNREVLAQELELLEHDAVVAIHGRDALDRLGSDTVDQLVNEEYIWGNAVHRVVSDGITPEQAVDEAIARIKQILSE